MGRFDINFSREHSKAFRLFIKRLYKFLSQLDAEALAKAEANPGSPAAHSLPIFPGSQGIEARDEQKESEERAAITKERGRVGRLLFNLTVNELREEGKPLSPWNMAEKENQLRRKLKVPETNLDITTKEIQERYKKLSVTT